MTSQGPQWSTAHHGHPVTYTSIPLHTGIIPGAHTAGGACGCSAAGDSFCDSAGSNGSNPNREPNMLRLTPCGTLEVQGLRHFPRWV
jgi:hypothetical protein